MERGVTRFCLSQPAKVRVFPVTPRLVGPAVPTALAPGRPIYSASGGAPFHMRFCAATHKLLKALGDAPVKKTG